jgi:hypothetical protein
MFIGTCLIPANAGTHATVELNWIPAFAGMTDNRMRMMLALACVQSETI